VLEQSEHIAEWLRLAGEREAENKPAQLAQFPEQLEGGGKRGASVLRLARSASDRDAARRAERIAVGSFYRVAVAG
jgi:hypothetical protein